MQEQWSSRPQQKQRKMTHRRGGKSDATHLDGVEIRPERPLVGDGAAAAEVILLQTIRVRREVTSPPPLSGR